jgi:ribosomal protein L13E
VNEEVAAADLGEELARLLGVHEARRRHARRGSNLSSGRSRSSELVEVGEVERPWIS